MNWEVYTNVYLHSFEWQKKRIERLKLDRWSCVECGSRYNLQVHHINYNNIGQENVEKDLVTLCQSCHEEIEKQKQSNCQRQKTVSLVFNSNIKRSDLTIISHWAALEFCKENILYDYAMGGLKNYCRIDVVKSELGAWLHKNGFDFCYISTKVVLDFFSARRYEVILNLLHQNYSVSMIEQKMNFKRKMIDNVKKDRNLAFTRKMRWDAEHENIYLRHALLLVNNKCVT